mmetsp:Transcript_55715/g.154346  ORF Transcript_55715/g.154346 Transcript_55715/m.154346 type:complete len:134 (+) Transcript_55715:78-479(+)
MPKYYCEYCDLFLTHSGLSGRKQHLTGRRHINNKIEYYQMLIREKGLTPPIYPPPPGMVLPMPKMPTPTAPTPSPTLPGFRPGMPGLPGFGGLGGLPGMPKFPGMPGMMTTFPGMTMPRFGVGLTMPGMRPPM